MNCDLTDLKMDLAYITGDEKLSQWEMRIKWLIEQIEGKDKLLESASRIMNDMEEDYKNLKEAMKGATVVANRASEYIRELEEENKRLEKQVRLYKGIAESCRCDEHEG